jgi:fatty-acyl-CoA synthase
MIAARGWEGSLLLQEYDGVGMGHMLIRRARMNPNAPALRFEDLSLTYEDLERNIVSLAWALKDQGVEPGDRIGYLGLNDPKFLEVLYASALIGAIFVPINYRLTAQEITFIANDAGLKMLFADEPSAVLLQPCLEKLRCDCVTGVNFESAEWPPLQGVFPESPSTTDALEIAHTVKADDVVLIMYTSGTTGRPKGATLTHGNIFWNLLNAKFMEETMRGATLTCAPLFHIGGLNVTTHPSLVSGVQVILHREFNAAKILADIQLHRVSTMFGAPTMFDMLMRETNFEGADFSSVMAFNCGAAPVPLPLIDAYAEKGVSFCQGYGLTETSPYVSVLSTADARQKKGSAGMPLMFTQVKIVGPDDKPMPVTERGEILVHGPNVTPGYWQLPEATREAFTLSGWFRTGDIGYLDEEGYLFICDRKKDMIITGGENVYPAEVESELVAHPDIAEVAVVGLPDEKWGETVAAVITLSSDREPSLEDLNQFLADRLARYKRPRVLHVTDLLPRNPAGKVQKFVLRDRLAS